MALGSPEPEGPSGHPPLQMLPVRLRGLKVFVSENEKKISAVEMVFEKKENACWVFPRAAGGATHPQSDAARLGPGPSGAFTRDQLCPPVPRAWGSSSLSVCPAHGCDQDRYTRLDTGNDPSAQPRAEAQQQVSF